MEDLDKTLDIMETDKCTSLLQENSVRTKKNNIKFTKLNKKNSQEHLDAQIVSYERLVRNLIKQLLNLEKKIRLKYLIPLDEERALKLMGWWNTEVECALEDLSKKYRVVHIQRRTVEEFDEKLMAMRAKAKVEIEREVPKLLENLAKEIGSSERFDPKELSKIYGLDESVLVDLQVIDPLQKLHESYRKLRDAGFEKQLFKGLEDAIRIFVKNIKEVEGIVWSGRSADQRKEYKMNMLVALKAGNKKEYVKWNSMQMAVKRLLASLYGVVALQGFGWEDVDLAASITASAREAIREAAFKVEGLE